MQGRQAQFLVSSRTIPGVALQFNEVQMHLHSVESKTSFGPQVIALAEHTVQSPVESLVQSPRQGPHPQLDVTFELWHCLLQTHPQVEGLLV